MSSLYDWYNSPGEVIGGIGFYINPYDRWKDAKLRHVFAFDEKYNLYVGQHSIYDHHINTIFGMVDCRERGLIYPVESLRPTHSSETKQVFCSPGSNPTGPQTTINLYKPVIYFKFLETKNINYLNIRLKKLSQRLYDYGMPETSVIDSKDVDLWLPSLKNISGTFTSKEAVAKLQQSTELVESPSPAKQT